MFKKMQNIDTAFRHIRTFSIVFLLACVVISGLVMYKCFSFVHNAQKSIYILANGKAIEAFSADRNENIPVEARDHVRTFHQYFFNLDPDEKVIQSNISKALYLADNSAEKIYLNLKEQNYYADLISGNISQKLTIDSVQVDIGSNPYAFHCYAHEKMIRSTSTTIRSLITEGFLRSVARSDNNPHGFLIEKWNILENKDIKTDIRP